MLEKFYTVTMPLDAQRKLWSNYTDAQAAAARAEACKLAQLPVSAKSRRNSRKPSAEVQAKDERRKPAPKLSETDYLLSLWQSDCTELRLAGVELRLEKPKWTASPP